MLYFKALLHNSTDLISPPRTSRSHLVSTGCPLVLRVAHPVGQPDPYPDVDEPGRKPAIPLGVPACAVPDLPTSPHYLKDCL